MKWITFFVELLVKGNDVFFTFPLFLAENDREKKDKDRLFHHEKLWKKKMYKKIKYHPFYNLSNLHENGDE